MAAEIDNISSVFGATPGDSSPTLTPVQNSVATASVTNFLRGTPLPPTTAVAKAKVKAAIDSFNNQIKKAKEISAKLAKTSGKTGPKVGAQTLAAKQVNRVGANLPGIANFLPPGTNLSNTTFDEAINSMQAAIVKLQELAKAPANAAITNSPSPAVTQAANNVPQMSTTAIIQSVATTAAIAQAQIQPKQSVGGNVKGSDAVNVRSK